MGLVIYMSAEDKVDQQTIEDIVEGRYKCCTLLQLRDLAKYETNPDKPADKRLQKLKNYYEKHIKEENCDQCRHAYESLKAIELKRE